MQTGGAAFALAGAFRRTKKVPHRKTFRVHAAKK